jgi:NAD(P)-dependent dehydrogenase (short-subunit alcohol dehydrogenase family)
VTELRNFSYYCFKTREELRNYFALNAQILYWIFVAPLRGKPRFKFSQVFHQMVRIGVQALPMTSLTAFSIGLTMAMQGALNCAGILGPVAPSAATSVEDFERIMKINLTGAFILSQAVLVVA